MSLMGRYRKTFMSQSAKLVSLATAVPPHKILQRDAASAAYHGFSHRFADYERLSKVFESSGIKTRYAVKPLEWYLQPLGWPERAAAYIEGACDLYCQAATKALDEAGLSGRDIDTVITVSSTGIATPSLDARVAQRMGFRDDVERVPVFGLGCAGGVAGISIARRMAQSRPGTNVLMVTVELCTLSFRLDELSKANIVATALFGDGAAACVVSADDSGSPSLETSGQHTWPGTLDIMGWSVEPDGLGVIFDRAIPPFAEANIEPAISGILARGGLSTEEVDRFVCHPGGAKVIRSLERAFSLGQGALDHERDVLSDFGNMSAPTVLFVMRRVMNAGLPRRSLMLAMGPGFSTNAVSVLKAA